MAAVDFAIQRRKAKKSSLRGKAGQLFLSGNWRVFNLMIGRANSSDYD